MVIEKYVKSTIVGFIGLVLLFNIVAGLFPSLVTAGTTLNASGIPLGTMFLFTGTMGYIVAGVLILIVVALLFGLYTKKKD
jgi:hypothetical protein